MNVPHNIFAFEVDLTLYIFVAYGQFDFVAFNDYIDKASLKHVPDKIAIFYHEDVLPDADRQKIVHGLKSRFRCEPSLLKFDRKGQFENDHPLVNCLFDLGKREIIKLREPVQLPPPGKAFMKPSGKRESFFIQASNLFVRHSEMSFIALLLIREWGSLFDENVKVVYVDTIDLYGLTSLACKMRFGNKGLGPITVSYSSYTCYKEVLKHADVANSLMAISATTSHSLLDEITKQTRWRDTDRVVTILGIDPKTLGRKIRINNPKVIAHVTPPDAESHISHLPAIRLSGEKFSVEVDDPKAVVFRRQTHGRCLTQLKLPKLIQMQEVFAASVVVDGATIPISIDRKKLLASSVFRDWLKTQIENHAPIGTTHIVLIDVEESETEPLLEVFGAKLPTIVTPKDLLNPELNIPGCVLVICPTFSTGSKLLEVSRDLRKQSGLKNVVYLTGIGTPESSDDFEKLRKNLEVNGFRVISFCNVAIGLPKTLALSWQTERELIRKVDGLNSFSELSARAQKLDEGNLDDANIFYRVADLELHANFKYWDSFDYDSSQRPSVLMFITFAFLLQDARTNAKLPEEDRLAQLPNRRVLLDPENFFRYNDTLIQVSILRAAFPAELDYSDHEPHSRSILYFLQRVAQVQNRAVLYELLLAIATERLQITSEALKQVKTIIATSDMAECKWFAKVPLFGGTIE